MNEREVVAGLPLVTDEEAAEAVVPAVGPFNDSALRLAVDASDERLFAATTECGVTLRSHPLEGEETMKRTLLVWATAISMSLGAGAAAEAGAAPDCAEKKTAVDEASAAAKAAAKPDLFSCEEMKGKEKKDCEKPLKAQAKEDAKAAKDKVKEAKTALGCCKNPKKKGCS